MSKSHTVKVWPIYFERLESGKKTCEVRKNDRDYQAGDMLNLVWYDPATKKLDESKRLQFVITHVLSGGNYGIDDDYCVLSLRKLSDRE